jgi:predicted nucleic acid-binding protein
MVRRAVFNSSPWIFLTKLGAILPALSLFEEVCIPLSVSEEILGKQDESSAILKELQVKGKIHVIEAENKRLANALGSRLGKGEAEAIVIAIEKEADLVCLDDHAARSEAMRLGLEVKGTLGVLRRLMEMDSFRCNVEDLLENLKRMNFRVKGKIFWEIFRDVSRKTMT